MTPDQVDTFISEVLKGFWPRWEPNDQELRAWQEQLEPFDFHQSKAAINNVFFSLLVRGVDPPAGKIMSIIRQKARRNKQTKRDEPVTIYEIIKEGNKHGLKFAEHVDRLPKDPQVVENEAEMMREKCNQMYHGNHIILRLWEKYY